VGGDPRKGRVVSGGGPLPPFERVEGLTPTTPSSAPERGGMVYVVDLHPHPPPSSIFIFFIFVLLFSKHE
jgi:hypothetical protein